MSMLASAAPVVGSGVDYFTMTCNRQGAVAGLLRWRDERFDELVDQGYERRPVGGHGYTGTRVGPLDVQIGPGDVLIRMSGGYAARHWRSVGVHATNVSRLDLETTARPGSGTGSVARAGYLSAQGHTAGRGRRPAYTLITGTKTGDTLYVGRRISDQWGRLYDKARESGDPHYAGCWRYEVEYHGKPAYRASQALLATREEGEMVRGAVHSWFSARGVRPVYGADSAPIGVGALAPVADYERWLRWIRRVVRPRAQKELGAHQWRDIVMAAVGGPPSRADLEAWLATFDAET